MVGVAVRDPQLTAPLPHISVGSKGRVLGPEHEVLNGPCNPEPKSIHLALVPWVGLTPTPVTVGH